jgi:transposase InsO family protein
MILALVDEAVRKGARRRKACSVLGLSTRAVERWRQQGLEDRRYGPRQRPANRLSDAERRRLLDVANSSEYCDLSPKQIVPLLADRGLYLASESTLYRLLRENEQLSHRGRSRPAITRARADHVAARPNQVWSWDITYLKGPARGSFLYLYMVIDLYSRRIMGWEVHEEESAELASQLIRRTCLRNGIEPGQLTLHSDNGGPMKGSTMLATLQWLGILPSFSRPRVSDDNPFSESVFRTLKYRPTFPDGRFGSGQQARDWVGAFVAWYNGEHLHSALRFVTPDDRHAGRDAQRLELRRAVYQKARSRRPERWARQVRDWSPVGATVLRSFISHSESEPLRSTRPPSPRLDAAPGRGRVKAAAGAPRSGVDRALRRPSTALSSAGEGELPIELSRQRPSRLLPDHCAGKTAAGMKR